MTNKRATCEPMCVVPYQTETRCTIETKIFQIKEYLIPFYFLSLCFAYTNRRHYRNAQQPIASKHPIVSIANACIIIIIINRREFSSTSWNWETRKDTRPIRKALSGCFRNKKRVAYFWRNQYTTNEYSKNELTPFKRRWALLIWRI